MPEAQLPLNRRHWLALAATVGSGAWLSGCALPRTSPPEAPSDRAGLGDEPQTGRFTSPRVEPGVARPLPEGGWVLDVDDLDPRRGRAVPLRFYVPAQAASDRPVPLVVLSHGLGGSRRGYSHLGRQWAQRGWLVAHTQHVGSDNQVWTGSLWGLPARLQAAAGANEALSRVRDVQWLLDRLLAPGGWPWPDAGLPTGCAVDPSAIAVAGHSYGANTAMLLAGAAPSQPVAAPVPATRDHRVKAAVLLSAPPLYGEGEPARALAAVAVPTLHITTAEDAIRVPGYESQPHERIQVFENMGGVPRGLLVFERGGHSIFTDRLAGADPELSRAVKGATQQAGGWFLSQAFRGEWPTDAAMVLQGLCDASGARLQRLTWLAPTGTPNAAQRGQAGSVMGQDVVLTRTTAGRTA